MDRIDLATSGLFVAWLANDIEELVTMPADSRRLFAALPAWAPIPAELRRDGLSREHVTVAVALMAAFMGAAAYDGYRSRGRSWVYQNVLQVFGLHGFGHLASALARRSYSTGVLTSPTVVIPFWLRATRVLREEGVPDRRHIASIAGFPVLGVGVHRAAHAITGH